MLNLYAVQTRAHVHYAFARSASQAAEAVENHCQHEVTGVSVLAAGDSIVLEPGVALPLEASH